MQQIEPTLAKKMLLKRLQTLFPFYVIISKNGNIVSCGTRLRKWICPNEYFDDVFHETWESTGLSEYNNLLKNGNLQLTCKRFRLKLQGTIMPIPESENLVLLTHPVFHTLTDINNFEIPTDELINTFPPCIENSEECVQKRTEDSEKLQTERNLRERLAKIMEETSNGVILIGSDNKIDWVNSAFINIFDFTSPEIIGLDLSVLLARILRNVSNHTAIVAAAEAGLDYLKEMKGTRKNGTLVDLRIRLQTVHNSDKRIAYQCITIEDITEQKKIEAFLRRGEQLWQLALESSGDGIWMVDMQDTNPNPEFTFFSSYKKLLGYHPSCKFTHETLKQHLNQEDYEEFIKAILSTSRLQPSVSYSCDAFDVQGHHRHILIRAKVVDFHDNDAPARLIGTITDVTQVKHLEEESMAGIHRLTKIITNLRTGILLEDSYGRAVCVNKEFCRLFDVPVDPDSLVGINWTDRSELVLELVSDRASFLSQVNRLREEKRLDIGDHLHLSDGRILSVDYMPLTDERGRINHLWQYTDITDDAVSTRKIEEQKQFYETILHELPVGVNILSPDYKYLFANRYSIANDALRAWVIGRDDFEYYRHIQRDRSKAMERRALFMQAVSKQQPIKYVDIVNKDDHQHYFLHIFYPHVVNGKVKLVIEHCTDITEQKVGELSLIRERARIKDLIDVINDGIFLCNHEGDITYNNTSFSRLTGTKPGDSPGNVFQLLEDTDAWMFRKRLREIRNPQDFASGIAKVKDRNIFVDYFITHSPSDNETSEIIGRFSDVTNQVIKEKTLNELVEKEKELNDLKTRFIRIASHELRTPLTVILSNMEILQLFFEKDQLNKELTKKYGEHIERVLKEVYRMDNLLADLVVVGRIEDGKEAFDFSEGDLNVYITEIVQDLFYPYSDGRKLSYEITNPAELQTVTFCKRMFRHCIVNVLSNAFKYSSGSPAPLMRVHADAETVTIEVQDFGIGIPDPEISKVSMSFFRGSNVGNTFGTGIGLMLTEYIIKAHHGAMSIQSQLNVGTTVTLTIPKNITAN